jgi:hypothetical protein
MPRRMTLSKKPHSITDEGAAGEARLADLHQHESALEASQSVAREQAKRWLPTFVRASQNVSVMAVLMDALSVPSTKGADEVYQ